MQLGRAVEGLKSEMLQDDADDAGQVLGLCWDHVGVKSEMQEEMLHEHAEQTTGYEPVGNRLRARALGLVTCRRPC